MCAKGRSDGLRAEVALEVDDDGHVATKGHGRSVARLRWGGGAAGCNPDPSWYTGVVTEGMRVPATSSHTFRRIVMVRSASIVGLVVLLWGGVAYGQGEVRSYYQAASEGPIIIPSVPTGGFVVTDIVVSGGSGIMAIHENGVSKLDFGIISPEKLSYHFESGIVFSAGTEVRIAPDPRNVTLSGYIPSPPAGGIPTVSQWGLVVMVTLILIAGSVVFARRRVAVA